MNDPNDNLMSDMDKALDSGIKKEVDQANRLLAHNRRLGSTNPSGMSEQRRRATQQALWIKGTLRGGSGSGRGDNPHG